jgi:hypothetical protein
MATLCPTYCRLFRDDILNAIPSEVKSNNSQTSVWIVTNCDTMDPTGTPQSHTLGILCAQSPVLAADSGFLRFALGMHRPSTIRNCYAVSMCGMERGPGVAKRPNFMYRVTPSRSASGSQGGWSEVLGNNYCGSTLRVSKSRCCKASGSDIPKNKCVRLEHWCTGLHKAILLLTTFSRNRASKRR